MTLGSDIPKLPDFPTNDVDAEARFERFRHTDPFPDVRPALLNSADLLDYVATVGMLSPYEITPKLREDWLKPASCAVACTGNVLRFGWDTKKQRLTKTADHVLKEGDRLQLPANSITYLHLGTIFRIPDYMAARFNLAIREIHRGLLVGTGPLVDPGFVGQLFVPLHNLTSNEYSVKFGEPLVWVEFTKLSPNPAWHSPSSERRVADYVPFPERKLKRKTPALYLDHANDGKPVASSIPEEVERAMVVANEASDRVQRVVRTLRNIGIVGSVLAVLAVLLPMINLVSDTNARIDSLSTDRVQTKSRISTLEKRNGTQRRQIARLISGLELQATEIRRLRARAASSR